MRFSSGSFALLAAVLFLIPSPVEAQQFPETINMVERVVAVVGDSMISMTQLDESLFQMEARGWTRPTGAAELLEARLEVLGQLINQQLIIQEAAKDTLLEVSEEELEDRVQQQIEGQVRQFGTLGALQRALAGQNMTMAVYREQQQNLILRQLLQERYFAKRGQSEAGIVVTEEEARTYFEENQDLIPERPMMIRFENIQLPPEPSDAAKAEALAEADSVLGLLRDGAEFAELAERFSGGPTASSGGELGWIRQDGAMVEEFEEVAFGIPPGVASLPVETQFGYHLILVERVRGGERRVRHILFQPEITASDVEANDIRAGSFTDRLRAGDTMVDLGQEADTIDMPLEAIAQTSQALARAMQDAQAGDVVGPVRVDDPQGQNTWIVGRVLGMTPGGRGEFSDFQDMIVERLRSEGLSESVIEELRNQAYIDIRIGGG
jgi:peptidyl-prolyl cis-trans isomerase SurA